MRQYLKDLNKCRPGQKISDVLTAKFINAIVDAIHGLARGENIIPSPNLLLKKGDGWVSLSPTAKPTTGAVKPNPLPWDVISQVGVGEPNPTTGRYANFLTRYYPGSIGGVMPSNIFEDFTIPAAGIHYLVAETTTGDGKVLSVELSLGTTHPIPPAQMLGGPPSTVDVLVGVWVDGVYFNVLRDNANLTAVESLRDSDPDPSPFGLPYRSYYVWRVDT
jgi:hypothetical protein